MNRVEYTPFEAGAIECGIYPAAEELLTQHCQATFQRSKDALALLKENKKTFQIAQRFASWTAPKALTVTFLALAILFGGIFGARALFLNKHLLAGSLLTGGAALTYLTLSYFIARGGRYAPLLFLAAPVTPLYFLSKNGETRQNLPALENAYKVQLQTTAQELKIFFGNHENLVLQGFKQLLIQFEAQYQLEQSEPRSTEQTRREGGKVAEWVEVLPTLIEFYRDLKVH